MQFAAFSRSSRRRAELSILSFRLIGLRLLKFLDQARRHNPLKKNHSFLQYGMRISLKCPAVFAVYSAQRNIRNIHYGSVFILIPIFYCFIWVREWGLGGFFLRATGAAMSAVGCSKLRQCF